MLENNFCTTGVHTLLSCQKAKFRNLRVTPSCLKGYYFLFILKNFLLPICKIESFNLSKDISNSVYLTSLILNPPDEIILLASEFDFVIRFSVSKFGRCISFWSTIISGILDLGYFY